LWRQRLDGGAQTLVAGLRDQIKELSVARKGGVLVYGPGGAEDYNVWRYTLPPSRKAPAPIIASSAFDGDARYSPDGTRIAFASDRSGQFNIWVCQSDGTGLRQVTSTGAGGFWAGSPSWSPDGKRIAFDSRSPRTESSIFVIDAEGGSPVRLTGPGPSDMIPSWSRDSRWVYFASTRGSSGLEIWKVPVSGGQPVQVTRNGGLEAFESPDGRYLYYTKRNGDGGFWRMPLQGGTESHVPGLEPIDNRFWDNSPEGIYFVERGTEPALRLFRFPTGKISRIVDLPVPPNPVFRGLSMSPDRRGFLYMHADVGKSNLMYVDNFR
jgi:Tol biopolymer transport system component